MASSAFRSTTRRDLHSSTTTSRSDPPPCPRRSRSVSAAPRARGADSLREEDYANTRTNPLFDAAASPSGSPSPSQGTASSNGGGDVPRRDRGREPVKSGGRAGGGRARSVSVAPQRRHTASTPSAGGAGGAVGGRKASQARLVADHARPYRGSETDVETKDPVRQFQSWRSRHSISEGKHRGTDASCSSQGSTTGVGCQQTNEITNLESSSCRDPVLEIPPEFDPDSAEFISDICDYAAEYRKKDVVEIPLDFDTDAAELVSDMRNSAEKQHWEQMEIPLEFDTDASDLVSEIWQHEANQRLEQLEAPLEFDPDTSGLAPDITEYTIKLKQSHERARKLRADLAVEEQREQELSRMLKGIVTAPNFTETHKKRPRRKGFDKQTQCSISITGSDASDSVIFSNTKAHLKFGSNSTEDLDGFDTPRSRSSCFSFTHEPLKNVENCDVRQYLGNFGRGNNMELRETRSTYFADDYVSHKVNLDLLKDMATFQNRMQYGGLLICNIRTF
nr:unnamed protein product [Digitaria exilis]